MLWDHKEGDISQGHLKRKNDKFAVVKPRQLIDVRCCNAHCVHRKKGNLDM